MNRRNLIQFLLQALLISAIYAVILFLNLYNFSLFLGLTTLVSVTFIFVISGVILFLKLPDQEPIAGRFLIMTMVQLISILSLEAAFIYTNQSLELILNSLSFALIHFVFQTIFLVRIQKK
jgi:hypothetical protein